MQHSPPVSRLPAGASKWATVNEVAIRTGRAVRSVKDWCRKGLHFVIDLAGGYGGLWVAVDDDGWPLSNPVGASAYREQRSASAMKGALLGAQASVAARRAKAKKATRSSSRRSA